MASDLSWRLAQGIKEQAVALGETIAESYQFKSAPVDPFEIIRQERRIFARGADFGNAFDGRLEYQTPQFLLFYNTKYNAWPHDGGHHPKVRFTVAHELGHYFIDEHREFLRRGGGAHRSFAEFRAEPIVEQQADHFAVGLLMPSYLLSPLVNEEPWPSFRRIKAAQEEYEVPLVSFLVRWTQLSHFPCATLCVSDSGVIRWGFVSEGFHRAGAYRATRNAPVRSADARRFAAIEPSFTRYREGNGKGYAESWLEIDRHRISVAELYVTVPYRHDMFVVIVADENELAADGEDRDDFD